MGDDEELQFYSSEYINLLTGFDFQFNDRKKKTLKNLFGFMVDGHYVTYWDPPVFGTFKRLLQDDEDYVVDVSID